jgi:hypothetical protein
MLHILSRMKPFFGGAKARSRRRILSRELKPRMTLLEPRALLSSSQGIGAGTIAAAASADRSALVRDATADIKVMSLASPQADPTKTVLKVNRTIATELQLIILTVTVKNADYIGGIPSGTVKFFDGKKVLGHKAVILGFAEFTAKDLGVGKHVFRAVYEGDPSFTGSSSSTVTVRIIP